VVDEGDMEVCVWGYELCTICRRLAVRSHGPRLGR
jgi:hypothetical protein